MRATKTPPSAAASWAHTLGVAGDAASLKSPPVSNKGGASGWAPRVERAAWTTRRSGRESERRAWAKALRGAVDDGAPVSLFGKFNRAASAPGAAPCHTATGTMRRVKNESPVLRRRRACSGWPGARANR